MTAKLFVILMTFLSSSERNIVSGSMFSSVSPVNSKSVYCNRSTNSLEQCPFCEANTFSDSREIYNILSNPKIQYYYTYIHC
jgi:hypothetical protein